MTERRARRGFVLLLAILAVVVVGALIVATHTAVHLEHDVAVAGMNRHRAFAASEHALWTSVADWSTAGFSLPRGASLRVVIKAGDDSATLTTTRIDEETFWLTAEAEVGDAARRARRETAVNVAAVSDSAGERVTPVPRSWAELH